MKIRAADRKHARGHVMCAHKGLWQAAPLLMAAEGQRTWPAGADFKGFLILFSILISDLHGKDYATEVY